VVRKLPIVSSMELQLFAHDLLNPPAEDRKCEINLDVVNSTGRITLTNREANLQTRYLLKVQDPSLIDFVGLSEKEAGCEMKDLVLGCNLALERACLSTLRADLSTLRTDFKVPESSVEIEHTKEGVVAHITQVLVGRAYITMKVITKDELDEARATEHLSLFRKLKRHNLSVGASIEAKNLSRALSEFEQGLLDLPTTLIPLRRASTSMITDRLRKVP